MNFYGKISGQQHTLAGRIAPMWEAMHQAIFRAAELPAPPVRFTNPFPDWTRNIARELTKTIFKDIVALAPRDKNHLARKIGRLVGLKLRLFIFWWKDINHILERDGLLHLSPVQQQKLDNVTGWEWILEQAGKDAGYPITSKRQFFRFAQRRILVIVKNTVLISCKLVMYVLNRPTSEILEFLSGLPEGFRCFLNTEAEFAKTGKRTEIYLVMLTYWPEIEEMRQQEKTHNFILEWLEKLEGKRLVEDAKIFQQICYDIKLISAPSGRPPKK